MRWSFGGAQWTLMGVAVGLLAAAALALLLGGVLGYLYLALGGVAAVVSMATALWSGSRVVTAR